MEFINNNINGQYPSEAISPKLKKEKEFILARGKAFDYNFRNNGIRLFYNNRAVMQQMLNMVQGKESPKYYQDLIDYGKDIEDKESFINIDWTTTNIGSKYKNLVVGKLNSVDYDVKVTLLSGEELEQKADYINRVKTYQNFGADLESVGIDAAKELTGETADKIPKDDDELEFRLNTDKRIFSEVLKEICIERTKEFTNIKQVLHEVDDDLFMYGISAVKQRMNGSYLPTLEKVDVYNLAVGYSNKEDFTDIQEVGEYSMMTIGEIRKLNTKLEEKELRDLAELYNNKNGNVWNRGITASSLQYAVTYPYDNFRVPTFTFYFYSYDEDVYEIKKNKETGNVQVFQKKPNASTETSNPNVIERKSKGSFNIYYGTWIMGTDLLLNYGLMKNQAAPKTVWGKPPLPIQIIAPNMKKGFVVSPFGQIVGCLRNINVARFKAQIAIAKAVPKGVFIDLGLLENISIGKGGIVNSPQEAFDLYLKTGNILGRSKDISGITSGNVPIREIENGIAKDFMVFNNTVVQEIQLIRDILGVNEITDGSTIKQDTGLGIANIAAQNTNNVLDYLFHGRKLLYTNVIKLMSEHIDMAFKYCDKKILGDAYGNDIMVRKNIDFDLCSFEIKVETKLSNTEWERVYQFIDFYAKNGVLNPEEALTAIEFTNIKLLKLYMISATKRKRKEEEEKSAKLQEQNGQIQQQSAAQAFELQMQTLQATITGKLQGIEKQIQGSIDEKQQSNMVLLEIEKERTKRILLQEQIKNETKHDKNELDANRYVLDLIQNGNVDIVAKMQQQEQMQEQVEMEKQQQIAQMQQEQAQQQAQAQAGQQQAEVQQ